VLSLISKYHTNTPSEFVTNPISHSPKIISLYDLNPVPSQTSTNFYLPARILETCTATLSDAIEDMSKNVTIEPTVSIIIDNRLSLVTSIDIPLYVIWLMDTVVELLGPSPYTTSLVVLSEVESYSSQTY
jgi:hypothetical protein